MANHRSALKRIRQNEARKVRNRLHAVSTRNLIKKIQETKDKKQAEELLPKVTAKLDKLSKVNGIHKNKASNLKSKLAKHVNSLS